MGMNQDLARLYGTPGAEVDESQIKQAEADLFLKLAAEQNIDLNRLSEDQIQELWDVTFNKTAEDDSAKHEESETKEEEKAEHMPGGYEEGKKEEKEAQDRTKAAQAEHERLKVAAAEDERADYLGRKMAHSYLHELRMINEAIEKQAQAQPQAQPQPQEKQAQEDGSAGLGSKALAKWHALNGSQKVASEGQKKQASKLDEIAVERAILKVAEANLDVDDAARRLDAVFEMGVPEVTKVASNLEGQVEVRSLELLEAAGYPINWNQQ
jgi:hypothetical protein